MGRFEEVTLGELREGDKIPGPNGELVTVVKGYDHHIPEKMYEIENDNGDTLKVSGNHLMYVESSIDTSYHPTRVKNDKKTLKKYDNNKMSDIRDYVNTHQTGDHDVSLHEVVSFMDAQNDQAVINVLQRIAASIGPVAEDNYSVRDLYDDEVVQDNNSIQKYDKREFFQQILALSPRDKKDKSIPVIVGRVITADQMFEEMEYSEISIPNPPSITS